MTVDDLIVMLHCSVASLVWLVASIGI